MTRLGKVIVRRKAEDIQVQFVEKNHTAGRQPHIHLTSHSINLFQDFEMGEFDCFDV